MLTNISHINGGLKYFRQVIDKLKSKPVWKYNYEKWYSNITQMSKMMYGMSSCNSFCPYKTECVHGKNILETIHTSKSRIIELENKIKYADIETARAELHEYSMQAINSADNDIHIIKAQTGLGKTEEYIQLIKNTRLNCIIAVPTNALKNDIAKRMKAEGIILKNHTIIIDEDIIKTILYTNKVAKEKFEYLRKQWYIPKYVKERIKYYMKYDGKYKKHQREEDFEVNDIAEEIRNDKKIDFNIERFINSIATKAESRKINPASQEKIEEVYYAWIKELPVQKLIIMSATADEEVYRRLYPQRRVKIYNVSEVLYTGKILQYPTKSCSRNWFRNEDNADEMEDSLLEEMSAAEGVNAEMKLKDHMGWAARRYCRIHHIRVFILLGMRFLYFLSY